jgi:EAL domain-containing protein (putative c-di-GMP-specific phosphodiesterase class I)/CheY-like chemotaxis protein
MQVLPPFRDFVTALAKKGRGEAVAQHLPNPATVQKMLVVDDDLVQRTVISKIAKSLGYAVMEAGTYAEAISCLREDNFDCIALDLSLGEHDGVEILRLLAEINCTAPIVLVSGYGERIINATVRVAKSLGLNVADALTKPLNLEDLRYAFSQAQPARAGDRRPRREHDITIETLRSAIEAREIVPFFQPKVDLVTAEIVGCEALARWISPRLGKISPHIFMALAERWGLMGSLTDLLLDQAIDAYRVLRASPGGAIPVSVNLSASLLSDLTLPEKMEQVLAHHEVPPSALVLEITESVAMSNVQTATDILVRLRLKGIQVSIDDFGTGYSSLAALAHMPFTELKIDQTFVKRCASDPDMAKIVNVCLQLAQQFNMKTVAEGIETIEVVKFLIDAGCNIGQGRFFSPAVDLPTLQATLANAPNRRLPLDAPLRLSA